MLIRNGLGLILLAVLVSGFLPGLTGAVGDAAYAQESAPADDQRAALELAEEQAFKEAALQISPSLVRIDTVGGLDVVGEMIAGTAPTTGMIISEDGFIISSAFNFINKPASVLVTLPGGRRLPATIIASDKLRMITLLKIDATGLKLPEAAPKESVRVGQWALALGQTYDGPLPSISVGIVSAMNRVWGKAVQTDAKVSPVNYGGPLVDVQGRVLGVLVPLSPQENSDAAGVEWYDSGIGFAIPLQDVYAVLPRLKLGVDLRPGLTGIAPRGADLYATKVVIDRVRYGSPAAKAGLLPGDQVEEIDGRPIGRIAQLMESLKSHLEGETISVTVRRGDQLLTESLTLAGELPPYELPFLGILPDRDGAAPGVGVRSVYEKSAALTADIQPRDVIVAINDVAVAGPAALADAITRLRPDDAIQLTIRRAGVEQGVRVKLGRVPEVVPAELSAAVVETSPSNPAAANNTKAGAADAPAADKGDAEKGAAGSDENPPPSPPRTGRFTDKLPGYSQEYWAYVPDTWTAGQSSSLLVWLHPPNTTMEASVYKEWKSICDYRGILLLAPKAEALQGWTENEADYVRELVKSFSEKYSVAPSRVAIHSFGGGCRFATQLAFEAKSPFRGVLMTAAPLSVRPPEHSPEALLQFHLIYGDKERAATPIQRTINGLRAIKFPTTSRAVSGTLTSYPSGDAIEEAGRWIDSLDRI